MYKRLEEYIEILESEGLCIEKYNLCSRNAQTDIKKISYNSKDVERGTLFICKGRDFKKEYLDEAIKRGAVCCISEMKITDKIANIVVRDIREAISVVSGFMHDHIWNQRLTEIGITGTKGKSTTAYIIKAILDCQYKGTNTHKTAMITGICRDNGQDIKASKLTTPETLELHEILCESISNGCDTLVMEVSSQGLKYKRVEDLKYKIGVFLNIEEDHISGLEHQSFDDYFHSKLELFKHCEIVCINTDIDEKYRYEIMDFAVQNKCKIVTFGTKEWAYYRGTIVEENINHIIFEMIYGSFVSTFQLNMGGAHNITNALAAIAVCKELGVSIKYIKKGLEQVKVPGRMEVFDIPGKDAKVIVDYAHNEMSYRALFDTIDANYTNYKKLFMFGCANGRAYNRRKEVAEIAKKEADKVVITKCDDGEEPFEKIYNEILQYMEPPNSDKERHIDVKSIEDRDLAVEHCLKTAEDGWIVVMTGCETDSETVRKYINLN